MTPSTKALDRAVQIAGYENWEAYRRVSGMTGPLYELLIAHAEIIQKYEIGYADQKLLCAREAMSKISANGSRAENFRCGFYDDTDHVRGAVLAIELWEKWRD